MSLKPGSGGFAVLQREAGQTRRTRLRLRVLLPFVLAAAGLVLWLWPTVLVLEVRSQHGQVLLAREVRAGATVDYTYVHSVEQTTVLERFQVVATGLKLVMTSFGAAGAGLPASHPALVMRDGRFVIEGLDVMVKELPLLGSDATCSVLEFGGGRYEVRGRVTVSVRRRPAWAVKL